MVGIPAAKLVVDGVVHFVEGLFTAVASLRHDPTVGVREIALLARDWYGESVSSRGKRRNGIPSTGSHRATELRRAASSSASQSGWIPIVCLR